MREKEKIVDEVVKYMRDLEFLVCGHCRKGGTCSGRDSECIQSFATIARKLVEAKHDSAST